jgi:hypothetical protein
MRCRLLVLWLLLALLPLRGWATIAMHAAPPGGHGAVALQAAPMPCHAAAADDARAQAADGTAAHAGCSMCDLCHSAAAFDAPAARCTVLERVARVKPLADADTGHAPLGGLERPPRHLHG